VIGSSSFSAGITLVALPALAIDGQGRTAYWSMTSGTYLDLAVDGGLAYTPGPEGSVTIPDEHQWVYILLFTKEGGVVAVAIPPWDAWPNRVYLPLVINR
jgi:hypothetical protein